MTASSDQPATVTSPYSEAALPSIAIRGVAGGVLMGLANLVPGISGGTMLLAAGVYPRFIAAIGELTTLKFRRSSVVLMAAIVGAAIVSIVLFAGPVKEMVVNYRWVMYSLFIGLTLGGVPVVWRLITAPGNEPGNSPEGVRSGDRRKPSAAVWIAAAVGFAAMAALALFQSSGAAGDVERTGFVFMLLAGVAGASAMILPGVSGGYLLLVLGVYVPVLAGIDQFKEGLSARDFDLLTSVGLAVVLPVGLGVLVGVVGVSNLLKWLLQRFEIATLGVLLGLLVGAVVGLWPFQQSVTPEAGMLVKGQPIVQDLAGVWVIEASLETVELEDLPTERFTPTMGQVAGSIALVIAGLVVTLLVDRLGREKKQPTTAG